MEQSFDRRSISDQLDKRKDEDNVATTVVGIGVIIILNHLAGLKDEELEILVVTEKENKSATGKKIGQEAIVQETIIMEGAHPEDHLTTLRGAIAEEVIGNEDWGLSNHFYRTIFERGRPETPLHTLSDFAGGLEVVFFTGNADDLLKPAGVEVGDKKKVTIGSFLENLNARPTSIELVKFGLDKNLIAFSRRQHMLGKTQPVFREGHMVPTRNSRFDITNVVK